MSKKEIEIKLGIVIVIVTSNSLHNTNIGIIIPNQSE